MAVQAEPNQAESAGLSADLVEILVCPVDKADLRLEDDKLVCTACGRSYPIDDGIPNMLAEDE